jgi:hypothetical protein
MTQGDREERERGREKKEGGEEKGRKSGRS